MSSYKLPANANQAVLKQKVRGVQRNLQSLDVSNCIVAKPESLLKILSSLQNLQTLSCTGCPLKPSRLLIRLLVALPKVTHLEFSLIEAKDDISQELKDIWNLQKMKNNQGTNLRKMYVEVVDEDNSRLLIPFLQQCPLLTEIHIHFTHQVRVDFSVGTCFGIVDVLTNLVRITLTFEAPSTTQMEPTEPLDLPYCVDIHGNVVYGIRSKAFNCALLRDLAASPDETFPLEPAVLVAVKTPELERQLLDAGLRHKWDQLRSLSIVLFARSHDDTVYPTVGATHKATLRDFFARLSNLVELNVSSLHFGDGVDFTGLLATPALQQVRALSLPPCGLRKRGAVRRLAQSLGNIEELDIRLNLDGRHKSCTFCNDELIIKPTDSSAFCAVLARVTLSNVPRLASLDFLKHVQLSHVRFIDVSNKPCFDYTALSKVLCSIDTLRSLVIKLPIINFHEDSFETLLCPANGLQCLCLITETKLKASRMEMTVEAMALRLPSIFYMHIHYVDIDTDTETSLTWIRLPDGDAEARPSRGKLMFRSPCVMCSTQTFIALAKPHFHELQ